ncbi:MAG TPA: hypothetical protein DCS21_04055 [Gammaproteobacteria bacterium]|nr:hypothetical protein [Gammaproteobacteria bacterium]
MLAQRGAHTGDSRYSWTVDFAARRARQAMQPLLDEAAQIKATVVDLKEQAKRLKKNRSPAAELALLEAQIREKDKAAHELEIQAADIDAAVFDLKAANPNPKAIARMDDRTSQEIIHNIETQGRIVADALTRLSTLLAIVDEQS